MGQAQAALASLATRLRIGDLDAETGSVFLARLGMQFPAIHEGFRKLYGDRDDFEPKLGELVDSLLARICERPADLRRSDRLREVDSDWFLHERWTATMLYVDRFAGSLRAFVDRIPYLERLGVNYVHLMPLLSSPPGENDGGYAVSDYRDVDPRFGTLADLENVAGTLHGKDMLLCLDVVMNHTADSHEWAKRALAGERKYQDYYHLFADRSIPDEYEKTLPEVFPDLAPGNFTWREEIGRWVMTVFNAYQWDLNYTNPDVFIEMVGVVLFLANRGVDVLRLDATPFIWKRIGTTSQNEPEAHLILQTMKACCQVVAPGAVFKSEAIVQPVEIVRYLGDRQARECDIAYNASLMVYLWDALATKNTRLLVRGLENIPPIPESTTWITYVRCHDDIGLGFSDLDARSVGYDPGLHRRFLIKYLTGEFPGSPCRGFRFMENPRTGDARISGTCASLCGLDAALERNDAGLIEYALRRVLLLYGVVFSIGGIPLVYYGDERGMRNDHSYLTQPELCGDNRWMHRPVYDWAEPGADPGGEAVGARLSATLARYAGIRRVSPEFSGTRPYQMMRNDNQHVFSFLRSTEERHTLVLANFAEDDQWIDAGILARAGLAAPVVDRISARTPGLHGSRLKVPALTCLWLSDSGEGGG